MTDRQQGVKEHFVEASQRLAEELPTALVGLTVQPDGHIRAVVLQVEPEHVLPVIAAMRQMIERLESYLTEAIANRHVLIAAVTATLIAADLLAAPAIAALLAK